MRKQGRMARPPYVPLLFALVLCSMAMQMYHMCLSFWPACGGCKLAAVLPHQGFAGQQSNGGVLPHEASLYGSFSAASSRAGGAGEDGNAAGAGSARLPGGTGLSSTVDPVYAAHYQRWLRYAEEQGSPLLDRDYSQVFDSLAPFEREGGINESAIRRLHSLYERVQVWTINATSANVSMNTKEGMTNARARFYSGLLQELHPHLPTDLNIKLAINLFDEPISWVAPLPASAEAALKNGSMYRRDAWRAHGCDALGMQDFKRLHGSFLEPPAPVLRHELLPVISPYIIPGCYADILAPHLGSVYSWHSGQAGTCAFNKTRWLQQKDAAVFRGSSTGGFVHDFTPPEGYTRFHRQRLVNVSQTLRAQGRTDIDAGITDWIQCSAPKCEEQAKLYGVANKTNLFNYRYNIIVDGNGAPDRLAMMLCWGSVPLKATLYTEWFYSQLRPYEHYIPVRLDYSDLVSQLDWARTHEAEVERIARNAADFVNRRLRKKDMMTYWYRLIIEYARIYRRDQ